MGILQRLGGWRLDDGVAPNARASAQATVGGGDVAQVLHLPDSVAVAFGLNTTGLGRVDRTTAMTIPAVRRGRQVIAGTIGALPLVAHRRQPDGSVVEVDRQLLDQPDPNTTRQYVLTWTVDDLLFYGVSWWLVLDRDAQGYPTAAERVAPHRLRVDFDGGRVYVDQLDRTEQLVRFDGPDEGVLTYGGRTLQTTLLLEDAVRKFARLDVPLGALKLQEGAPELSTEPGSAGDGTDRSEVDVLLDSWEQARRDRSTAYLNRAVEYQTYQLDAQRVQLAEGRSYQDAETARLMGLAPRYVNAPSASSMTYSNVESERRDLVDTTLLPYLRAVEQRLSMGDVTPRGTTVRFDLTQLLRGDTKTALEGAQIAVALGAMTADEVRTDVLGRTPLGDQL